MGKEDYQKEHKKISKVVEDAVEALSEADNALYKFTIEFLNGLSVELTKLETIIRKLQDNNTFQLLSLKHRWLQLQEDLQDHLNELDAKSNLSNKAEREAQKFLSTVLNKIKKLFDFDSNTAEFCEITQDQLLERTLFEIGHKNIGKKADKKADEKADENGPLFKVPPKCFISYAWGVAEHEKLAKKLSRHLKLLGLEVWLDVWDNPAGSYIDYFTTKIREADYVILLGSKKLLAKYMEGKSLYEEVKASHQKLDFGHKSYENRNYIVNLELHQIFSKGLSSPGSIVSLLLDGSLSECLPANNLQNVVPVHFTEHRDIKAYREKLFELLAALLPNDVVKSLITTKASALETEFDSFAKYVETEEWQISLQKYIEGKQGQQKLSEDAVKEAINSVFSALSRTGASRHTAGFSASEYFGASFFRAVQGTLVENAEADGSIYAGSKTDGVVINSIAKQDVRVQANNSAVVSGVRAGGDIGAISGENFTWAPLPK